MPYVPGGDCKIGPVKENTVMTCQGCFPSKTKSPIVVKICRPLNQNVNRMGYGNRSPTSRGDCCKWCAHKENANQMVFNQNKIANFDLINRINDASGVSPTVTYTATPPGGPPGKRKCDNCINILRDKELQLLKKEQEILKIKTHFTNLPKSGGQAGLGTNCEHCFKALREKEFELFKKEQEIAKMKMAVVAKSPLDTQAKVDKARCANCFKALRQKELELIKKEHALMKNMTRPNINVKNLNFCSCCRDKNKTSINRMKKQEDIRRKNRDNCFKQLRMKEIRLLAKEREIDKKIQKFREESIAKAKMDLEKTPDPRLIKPTTQEVLKCTCSCTGLPAPIKKKEKPPGICKYLYQKFPTTPKGGRGQTMPIATVESRDTKLSAKALQKRKCSRPCCFIKLASNMTACFLAPPKAKKPKELPEKCRFLNMLPWCSPGLPKTDVKCCIVPTKLEQPPPIKEQLRIEERNQKQKAIAIKAAKAAAKSAPSYRVDTIGQIRPGKIRPSPKEKLNVLEAEVLRSYGHKGLEAYKTKMAELKFDTEVAHAKLPKKIQGEVPEESRVFHSQTRLGAEQGTKVAHAKLGKKIQGEVPQESRYFHSQTRLSAEQGTKVAHAKLGKKIQGEVPEESRYFHSQTRLSAEQGTKVAHAKLGKKIQGEVPEESRYFHSQTRLGAEQGTKVAHAKLGKKIQGEGPEESRYFHSQTRLGAEQGTKVPGSKFRSTMGTFTTKLYDRATKATKQLRTKAEPGEYIGEGKTKGPITSKTIVDERRKDRIVGDDGFERHQKYKTIFRDVKTAVSRKLKARVEDQTYEDDVPRKYREHGEDKVKLPRKYRKYGEDKVELPRKYKEYGEDKVELPRKYKEYGEDKVELPRKYKEYGEDKVELPRKYRKGRDYYERAIPKRYRKDRDYYERTIPKRYRTKVDDEGYEMPRGYGSRHGSGDYYDEFPREYGSREKMRGPWYPSDLVPDSFPKYFKWFGRTLVYCAGCLIGIPCILFLCLCFLLSSCND